MLSTSRPLALFALLSTCAVACAASSQEEAASAAADTTVATQYVNLQSTDGTRVSLSYEAHESVSPGYDIWNAKNLVINVDNDAWHVGFGGGKAVRVVLMNFCETSIGPGYMPWSSQQLDISYTTLRSGSGFGYELQMVSLGDEANTVHMAEYNYNGANHCRQEIAVVVDGDWKTDPINGTHNFQFEFQKH
jgi:hypothetical protein